MEKVDKPCARSRKRGSEVEREEEKRRRSFCFGKPICFLLHLHGDYTNAFTIQCVILLYRFFRSDVSCFFILLYFVTIDNITFRLDLIVFYCLIIRVDFVSQRKILLCKLRHLDIKKKMYRTVWEVICPVQNFYTAQLKSKFLTSYQLFIHCQTQYMYLSTFECPANYPTRRYATKNLNDLKNDNLL